MPEYDPSFEATPKLDLSAISRKLQNLAQEIDNNDYNFKDYFEENIRNILSLPIGTQMLYAAESLVCEWLPTETNGQGVAFLYGGILLFEAIEEVNEEIADYLAESGDSFNKKLTPSMLTYEDRNKYSEMVWRQAQHGLIALDSDDTFADLEEIIIVNERFQPYMRLGAGWMVYQAMQSDIAA